jgi:hypothetical protein
MHWHVLTKTLLQRRNECRGVPLLKLLCGHIFDVKNLHTDNTGLTDEHRFFLLCRKIWIVSVIHHPAKQENPVFIQF